MRILYPRGQQRLANELAAAICELVGKDELAGCDGLAVEVREKN